MLFHILGINHIQPGIRIVGGDMSAYDCPLLIKNILAAPIINRPDAEIVYQDKRYSYVQFRQRVARLAGALQRLGVREGDTVAVLD